MIEFITSFVSENPGEIIAIVISIMSLIISAVLTIYANSKANEANELARKANNKSDQANFLSKQSNMLVTNVEFKTYYLKFYSIEGLLKQVDSYLKKDDHIELRRLINTLKNAIKDLYLEDVPFVDKEIFEELKETLDEIDKKVESYFMSKQIEIANSEDYNERNKSLLQMPRDTESIEVRKKEIKELTHKAQGQIDIILEIFK